MDPANPLAPVDEVMYSVAEEIETMHLLLPGPPAAGLALTSATTLIGQVIHEIDIQPELPPEGVRQLQLTRCDQCFDLLEQAVDAMRNPANYPTDEAIQNFLMHGHEGLMPPAAPENPG